MNKFSLKKTSIAIVGIFLSLGMLFWGGGWFFQKQFSNKFTEHLDLYGIKYNKIHYNFFDVSFSVEQVLYNEHSAKQIFLKLDVFKSIAYREFILRKISIDNLNVELTQNINSKINLNYLSFKNIPHIDINTAKFMLRYNDKLYSAYHENLSIDPFLLKNNISISAKNSNLVLPDLYKDELKLKKFTIDLSIDSSELSFKLAIPGIYGRGTVNLDENLKIKNFYFNTNKVNFDKLPQYYPDGFFHPKLTSWLKDSLLSGMIKNSEITWSENNWQAKLDVVNANLKYDKDWPEVNNIDTQIIIDSTGVQTIPEQSSIYGQKVKNLKVSVYHTDETYSNVLIDGEISSDIKHGIKFVKNSPLEQEIGNSLEMFNLDGNCDLSLKVDIPILDDTPSKVFGKLKFINVHGSVPNSEYNFKDLSGYLEFTENTLLGNKLDLIFANKPSTATIKKSLQDPFKILINSNISSQELNKKFSTKVFSGIAKYGLEILVPSQANTLGDYSIKLFSNLQGLKINLPYPLGKSTAESIPFKININQDMYHFNLNKILDATLNYQDNKLQSGHVAFGDKASSSLPKDKNLIITGEIAKLSLIDWESTLVHKSHKLSLPTSLDILVDDLNISDISFPATWLHYDSNQDNSLSFNGPYISGDIFDIDSSNLTVDLDYLHIQTNSNKQRNKLFDKDINMSLNFKCKDLVFDSHKFGTVLLDLVPRSYGYDILVLDATSDNLSINIKGQYQTKGGAFTQISGSIDAQNYGNLAREYINWDSLYHGSGKSSFMFKWPGSPLDFSLKDAEGYFNFDLKQGAILKVNPGIASILNIMNIESLANRIKSANKDIPENSFAYTSLVAGINCNNGILKMEESLIVGPTAEIKITGECEYITKQLNLDMEVIPRIGSSIPLAATIAAGNPVVGAAFWVLDLATGKKIDKISKTNYKVTGSWDNPVIK